MQITIDVPEIACARCQKTAPQNPSRLQRDERRGTAHDTLGNAWQLIGVDLPTGWQAIPGERALCSECSNALNEAIDQFVSPRAEGNQLSDNWADTDAAGRVTSTQSLTPPSQRLSVAPAAVAVEPQRRSNIPQWASPAPPIVMQKSITVPVLNQSRTAALPTHAPNIVTASAPTPPPAPKSLVVNGAPAKALDVPVKKSWALQTAQRQSTTSTIPQRPEEKVTVVKSAPPSTEPARVDPMVQPAPRQDVQTRVDKVVHADGASANRVLERDAVPGIDAARGDVATSRSDIESRVITVDETFTVDSAPVEPPALANGVHNEFGEVGDS